MNPADAKGYIVTHDNRVKQLNRLTISNLRAVFAQAQRARNLTTVFGGPVSKDEFIRDIIDLEFPEISQARDSYYASTRGV